MLPVKVDASRTNRSLAAAAQVCVRPQLKADVPLLVYRRLIDTAVAESKRVRYGLPTDMAIQTRWWIQEFRPPQTDRDEWERSFECACHWLGLDAAAERTRLLKEIDDAITRAVMQYVSDVTYRRRAAVLSCAGRPTAMAKSLRSGRVVKQFVLALVAVDEYEDVAGIERPDPPARSSASKRLPRPRRLESGRR